MPCMTLALLATVAAPAAAAPITEPRPPSLVTVTQAVRFANPATPRMALRHRPAGGTVYSRDGWTLACSAYANRSAIGISGDSSSLAAWATAIAHSNEGLAWTKCGSNPVLSPTDGSQWDSIYACSPAVVSVDSAGLPLNEGRIYSKPMHKYVAAGHAIAKTDDDQHMRWHEVEIGANLGYAGGPAATKAAIHQAASEGVITKLRAFEPWPAGSADPGRWAPATAPEVGAGWIADILSAHPDVKLLVSLSNYPYQTPADLATDPGKYLQAWPNASYDPDLLASMIPFTNRAALFDAEGASAAGYSAKLQQLKGNVSSLGLLERVTWEIGNEPDAPGSTEGGSSIYFWGTADQFGKVADAAYQQLQGEAPMLCCAYAGYGYPKQWPGVTAGSFETWARTAQERYPQTRLSWHLYLNGGENTLAAVLERAKASQTKDVLNGSSITEFGLFSEGDAAKLSVLQSPQLVVELSRLLAFAYETGVASIYYESLMDHPRKRGEYMGLFDRWGEPKLSYSFVRQVQRVIAGGYRATNSTELLTIIGQHSNRTLALAHNDAPLALDRNTSVVAVSDALAYNGSMLRANGWVILCISM